VTYCWNTYLQRTAYGLAPGWSERAAEGPFRITYQPPRS